MKDEREPSPDARRVNEVLRRYENRLRAYTEIWGVNIGFKTILGEPTDELCIIVDVRKKKPLGSLSPDQVIPSVIEGVKTDVIEYGQDPEDETKRRMLGDEGVAYVEKPVQNPDEGEIGRLILEAEVEARKVYDPSDQKEGKTPRKRSPWSPLPLAAELALGGAVLAGGWWIYNNFLPKTYRGQVVKYRGKYKGDKILVTIDTEKTVIESEYGDGYWMRIEDLGSDGIFEKFTSHGRGGDTAIDLIKYEEEIRERRANLRSNIELIVPVLHWVKSLKEAKEEAMKNGPVEE